MTENDERKSPDKVTWKIQLDSDVDNISIQYTEAGSGAKVEDQEVHYLFDSNDSGTVSVKCENMEVTLEVGEDSSGPENEEISLNKKNVNALKTDQIEKKSNLIDSDMLEEIDEVLNYSFTGSEEIDEIFMGGDRDLTSKEGVLFETSRGVKTTKVRPADFDNKKDKSEIQKSQPSAGDILKKPLDNKGKSDTDVNSEIGRLMEEGRIPSPDVEHFPMKFSRPPRKRHVVRHQNPSLTFWMLLAFFVAVILFYYPVAEETNNSQAFEMERFNAPLAVSMAKKLSAIGPKVIGSSQNSILAVDYIVNQIEKVKVDLRYLNSGYRRASRKSSLEYDVQNATGCFTLPGKSAHTERTLCYHNIKNIVVRLHSTISNPQERILVNCHYDSVLTSPGASDDGINCAIMLTLLRQLALGAYPVEREVLFLFNGAEEDGLLGSHAFITQHKWANNILAFINLESCGAGGHEILFQTGPKLSYLVNLYAESAHTPHASVIGEEIFQNGLIPSDTDFRIFRDFGKLKGYDFAYYGNGYVYHTKNDDATHLTRKDVSNTGTNIMALLIRLISDKGLKEKLEEDSENAVYFDVFGFSTIVYGVATAKIINFTVAALSVLTTVHTIKIILEGMDWRTKFGIIFIVTHNLLFGLMAILSVILALVILVEWYGVVMMWYTQWSLSVMYVMPVLLIMTEWAHATSRSTSDRLSLVDRMRLLGVATQVVITIFLMSFIELRTSYLFVIYLTPMIILSIMYNFTSILKKQKTVALTLYILLNGSTAAYFTYIGHLFYKLIIPILGRVGPLLNVEVYFAFITVALAFLIFCYTFPLTLLLKKWSTIQLISITTYGLFVYSVLNNTYGLMRYSAETPQRVYVMHIAREVLKHDTKFHDSGFLVYPMDPCASSTLPPVFENGGYYVESLKADCDEFMNCGFPSPTPSMQEFTYKAFWIPANPPNITGDQNVSVEWNELKGDHLGNDKKSFRSFNVSITGEGRMDVSLVPIGNAKLDAWSLTEYSPNPFRKPNGTDLYFIQRSNEYGSINAWNFNLTFDITNISVASPNTFKLAVSFRIRDEDKINDKGINKFVGKLPDWIHPTPEAAVYKEFIF